MLFPITFSIPESKIINYIPDKLNYMSSIIPNSTYTYTYTNEEDYYNQYKNSLFGFTSKKGGWDCLRHYEIMANGCIPWFDNLSACPPNTLSLFPKKLILNAMNELKDTSLINSEVTKKYVQEILNYTKEKLTTKAIAKYILSSIGKESIKNVLILSRQESPDYLQMMTIHGFKELFNSNCHEYPFMPYLYNDYDVDMSKKLYGRGFTYTRTLDRKSSRIEHTSIEELIKSHHFDLIIYPLMHRDKPFWELVNKIYDPSEIVLICGEDIHTHSHHESANYNVFVREL